MIEGDWNARSLIRPGPAATCQGENPRRGDVGVPATPKPSRSKAEHFPRARPGGKARQRDGPVGTEAEPIPGQKGRAPEGRRRRPPTRAEPQGEAEADGWRNKPEGAHEVETGPSESRQLFGEGGRNEARSEPSRSKAEFPQRARPRGKARPRSGPDGTGSDPTPGQKDGRRRADAEGHRPEPSRKVKQRPTAGGTNPKELTRSRQRRGTVPSSSETETGTR